MATELVKNTHTNSEKIRNIDDGVGVIDQLEPGGYSQEYIHLFDRTLEQVLAVDTPVNVNNSHHNHLEIESSASKSLPWEYFDIKNETFSTYLDHIELDDNYR